MPRYLYAILIRVTAYHLWAVGYVRDGEWAPLLAVPAGWTLGWTLVKLRAMDAQGLLWAARRGHGLCVLRHSGPKRP